MEWEGDRFKRVDIDYDKNPSLWFMTGYTPIDTQSAIVATSNAFAEEKNGRLATYQALQDASYTQLGTRVPSSWLGTSGARLGRRTWLFGCAGGLAAYRDGQWFYPDRVNWMLPGQNLAGYGARCVHAVATDSRGRIYAGTDRGLMIYDAGGEDDFMLTNDRPNLAFAAQAQGRLRQEAAVLLGALKPDSAPAKQARQVVTGDAEIEALKARIAQGMSARLEAAPPLAVTPESPAAGAPGPPPPRTRTRAGTSSCGPHWTRSRARRRSCCSRFRTTTPASPRCCARTRWSCARSRGGWPTARRSSSSCRPAPRSTSRS